MTLRARRLLAVALTLFAVGGAVAGYFILTGKDVPFIPGDQASKESPEPPPTCPLTGQLAKNQANVGLTPVAVKVENISVSRPQAGLNTADVVYEQPVEGGITRFMAIYHCRHSRRVGPVRSARLVDPSLLRQLGSPLFAYAGGVQQVIRNVARAGIIDVNFIVAEEAYKKDPNRSAPHNLFISTKEMYEYGAEGSGTPPPLFTYSPTVPPPEAAPRAKRIHLDFSPDADVVWRWNAKRSRWNRFHEEDRHELEGGQGVHAANVVVQIVEVRDSGIVDAAGNPSPDVVAVGQGKAYVFRDGRVIEGTWSRESRNGLTRFLDAAGSEIRLKPGTTWVELFPEARPFEYR
ncbi:MAG TPA: DUF3048 domain-containing protein [Actinomycetota bacterium]|nr:DUF3048 domain-containing protein [Actinomycetota bacterium]